MYFCKIIYVLRKSINNFAKKMTIPTDVETVEKKVRKKTSFLSGQMK